MAEIIGNQFGEKITLGRVLRVISDRRLKMTGWTDVWGRIVIEMRERVCTGSGNSGWAVDCFSCWAERFPESSSSSFFLFFILFFSVFLILL
jgi:hypothetical protein